MKWLVLDRDGVINLESAGYIKSPAEWHPIPGSLDAIAKLTQAGFEIVVTTNQSGVGRGLYTLDILAAIHQKMSDAISELGGRITDIFFCPHLQKDKCLCRKPQPGMLLEFGRKYNVDLTNIHVVGDSARDVAAARAVGALPLFVKTGYGEKTLCEHPEFRHEILVFADLAAVAEWLVGE